MNLSFQDDTSELRRSQNREQPELLTGSPPSDDFPSMLIAFVNYEEISTVKTEN